MDNNLQKLYKSLQGIDSGFTRTYDEFVSDMQDEEKRKRLHSSLGSLDKNFTRTYDEFVGDMGFGAPSPAFAGVKAGSLEAAQFAPPPSPDAKQDPPSPQSNASPDVPLNSAQQQTGFWKTTVGDVLEKLGAGTVRTGAGLMRMIEKFNAGSRIPLGMGGDYIPESVMQETTAGNYQAQDLNVGGAMMESAEKIGERGDRHGLMVDPETGEARKVQYSDLFKQGKIWSGLGEIMLTATESAPTSALAMAPGGLPLIVLSATGQKYHELDSNPETEDMPEWQKLFNASVSGSLEGLTEKLGAKVDKKMIEPFLKKMTEDTVKGILKKGGVNALIQTITEGAEEVVSKLGENAIDAATGVSDGYKPLQGVLDAFVYGAGGGAQFGGVTAGAAAGRAGQKAIDDIYALISETGVNIDPGIVNLPMDGQKEVVAEILRAENLTDEQKTTIINYISAASIERQLRTAREEQLKAELQVLEADLSKKVNPKTGTLVTATLAGSKQPVQVIGGLAVNFDETNHDRPYTPDMDNSDEAVYYIDEEGKTQVTTADQMEVESSQSLFERMQAESLEIQKRENASQFAIDAAVQEALQSVIMPASEETPASEQPSENWFVGQTVEQHDGSIAQVMQMNADGSILIEIEHPDGEISEQVVQPGEMGNFGFPVPEMPENSTENGNIITESGNNLTETGNISPIAGNVPAEPGISPEEAERESFMQSLPVVESGKDAGKIDQSRMTSEQTLRYFEYTYGKDRTLAAAVQQVSNLRKQLQKEQAKLDNNPFDISQNEKVAAIEEELRTFSTYADNARMAGIEQQMQRQAEQPTSVAVERQTRTEEIAAEEAGRTGTAAPTIAEKWEAAPKVEGMEDVITLANGEKIPGRYMLVPAAAPSPSHDVERNFAMTEGFPVNEQGRTVNDRDYAADQTAQLLVQQRANNYDERAVQSPVVVSSEGIVLSGNDRTMAGQIAARNGSDGAYVDYITRMAARWGFTPEQVSAVPNPRIVFVPDAALPYNTATFAKFNAEEKKTQNSLETAIKASKSVSRDAIIPLSQAIEQFEKLNDFYTNPVAVKQAVQVMLRQGIIQPNEVPRLMDGETLSVEGRSFLETLMLGSVLKEEALREIDKMRAARQTLMRSMPQLLRNASLSDYSLIEELNNAIHLLYEAKQSGNRVKLQLRQGNLFEASAEEIYSETEKLLSLILEGERDSDFRAIFDTYNNKAVAIEAGQSDLFEGILTKPDLLQKILNSYGQTESNQQTGSTPAVDSRSTEPGTESGEPTGTTEPATVTDGTSAGEQSAAESPDEGESGRISETTVPESSAPAFSGNILELAEKVVKDTEIEQEAAKVDVNPTEGQKEAGNYKMGHINVQGFDITIENPAGSIRSGKDWSIEMKNHYGYFKRTEGKDGDHIDVFVGPNPESGRVFVVDQVDTSTEEREFDESKVMLGFNSEEEARAAYLSNYEEGWQGLGAISETTVEDFKTWLYDGAKQRKPFSEYKENQPANPSRVEYESFDTRGYSYAIEKDGTVLMSGSNPLLGKELMPIKRWLDEAERYGGDLYIAPTDLNDIQKIDNDFNILGLSWEQVQEKQARKDISQPVNSVIPNNAIIYPKYEDLFPETKKTSEKPPETVSPIQKSESPSVVKKIEDFGEKIGGARKDLAQEYRKKLSDIHESDILEKPLSKIFPRPNFKELVASSALSVDNALFLNMLYDNIPAKPRVEYKLKRWVNTVNEALESCQNVLEYGNRRNYLDGLREYTIKKNSLSTFFKNNKPYQLSDEQKLWIDDKWLGVQALKELGFPNDATSLKGAEIKYSVSGENNYFRVTLGNKRSTFETFGEVVDYLKSELSNPQKKETVFNVYGYRNKSGYFVGKPIQGKEPIQLSEVFETAKEALAYLHDHRSEIQTKWDSMSVKPEERRTENRDRRGRDWRNGKDISPSQFQETFGFRGTEFGNWVNQSERQDALNNAFDALMDLSTLLDISPSALSLNGELGMAFGARGTGNLGGSAASAHYEPVKVVINLTKNRGAGSLAHEWWHALDNYFSRTGNDSMSFATYGAQKLDIRDEMKAAFDSVMQNIRDSKLPERSKILDATRSKPYWSSSIEMSARAFENYVSSKLAEQGDSNDYLVNFKDLGEWVSTGLFDNDTYPYPTNEETPNVNEKFDQFFNTIQEKEENGRQVLFRSNDYQSREAYAIREWNRAKNAVTEIAGKLGVELDIIETTEGLTSKKATAKGWYDTNTGKIAIVMPNHRNSWDVQATLLHEAVGHHGLRELFGEHFDTFLDNVHDNANEAIQRTISHIMQEEGVDQRTATEEYLSWLAEDRTLLDGEGVRSFFGKVKQFFFDMLAKVGIKLDIQLSDTELRYILWRSYQNLANPGRYRSIVDHANDVVMQSKLKVGDFAESDSKIKEVAENVEKYREDTDPEIKQIKEQAIATGTFMNAPNGKPSNLDERQWLQVRTKAFKDWFGDWESDPENSSKVVDENGEPQVVYHGTHDDFTEFKDVYTKGLGTFTTNVYGYFFTPSQEIAGWFGKKIMPVFMNVRNPKKIGKGKLISFKREWFGADKLLREERRSEIESQGYDGFYLPNISRGSNILVNNTPQYVAFSSNQIKSATENTGAFDAEDNDIRFRLSDEIQSARKKFNSDEAGKYDAASDILVLLERELSPIVQSRIVRNKADLIQELRDAGMPEKELADMESMDIGGAYYERKAYVNVGDIDSAADFVGIWMHEQMHAFNDYYPENMLSLRDRIDESLLDELVDRGLYEGLEELDRINEFLSFFAEAALRGQPLPNAPIIEEIYPIINKFIYELTDGKYGKDDNDIQSAGEAATIARDGDSGGIRAVQGIGGTGGTAIRRRTAERIDQTSVEGIPDAQEGLTATAYSGQPIAEFAREVDNYNRKNNIRFRVNLPPGSIPTPPVLHAGMYVYEVADLVKQFKDQTDEVFKDVNREMAKISGLYTAFIDRARPLEKYQALMAEKGAMIRDDTNAYADYITSASRATHLIQEYNKTKIQPLQETLHKIARSGKLKDLPAYRWNVEDEGTGEVINDKELTDYDRLSLYLQAKDIEEVDSMIAAGNKGIAKRGSEGFEKNVRNAETGKGVKPSEYVAEFEKAVGQSVIDDIWTKVRDVNKWALDLQLEYGLITREVYNEYTTGAREYYVPQRGWRERDLSGNQLYYVVGKEETPDNPFNTALVKAKGRTTLAGDPLAYMQSIGESSVMAALKNRTKQKFLKFAEENADFARVHSFFAFKNVFYVNTGKLDADGHAIYERTYEPPTKEQLDEDKVTLKKIKEVRESRIQALQNYVTKKLTKEQYDRLLLRLEKKESDLLNSIHVKYADSEASRIAQVTSKERKQHTVTVLREGKEYEIIFTQNYDGERVANNLNRNFAKDTDNELSFMQEVHENVRKGTRFMSAMMTQYNPTFSIANGIRDFGIGSISNLVEFGPAYQLQFMYNIGASQKTVWKYVAADQWGGKNEYTSGYYGKMLKEFFEDGSATGWSFLKDIDQLRTDMKRAITPTKKDAVLHGQFGLDNAFGLRQSFGMLTEVSELTTRFAEYITSREQKNPDGSAKYTRQECARHAKEISVNFDRKGNQKFFGTLFSFFNASIQGTNKLFRMIRNKKVRNKMIGVSATLMAGGLLQALFMPDPDDDDERLFTEWELMNNICIGKLKMPLPQGLRAFWGMGAQMGMAARGTKRIEECLLDGTNYFFGELIPEQLVFWANGLDIDEKTGNLSYDATLAVRGAIPTTLQPLYDVWQNTNFMGGTSYRTEFTNALKDTKAERTMGKRNVSEGAQWFSDMMWLLGGGDLSDSSRLKKGDTGVVAGIFDWNPSAVETLTRGYAAGTGKFFLDMVTLGRQVFDPELTVDVSTMAVANVLWKQPREYSVLDNKLRQVGVKTDFYKNQFNDIKKNNPDRYERITSFHTRENMMLRRQNPVEFDKLLRKDGTKEQRMFDLIQDAENFKKMVDAGKIQGKAAEQQADVFLDLFRELQ